MGAPRDFVGTYRITLKFLFLWLKRVQMTKTGCLPKNVKQRVFLFRS